MLRVPSSVSVSLKSASIRVQGRGIQQRCCRYCTKPEGGAKPEAQPSQPPPVPPKKSGGGVLKVLGAGVLLAGGLAAGTVAYAKTNPEFRKQVESNWPVLVPIMPYLLNETAESKDGDQLTLGTKQPSGPLAEFKSQLEKNRALKPSTTHEQESDEDIGSLPGLSAHEQTPTGEAPAVKVSVTKKDEASKKELLWKKEKEEKRAKEMQQKLAKQEEEEKANAAAYEAILSNITDSSASLTQAAIESQKRAVDATSVHTEKLKIALDDDTKETEEKEKQWKEVVTAAETKLAALNDAEKNSISAQEELQKLKSVIGESKKSKVKGQLSPAIIGAEETLKMLTYDLQQQTSEVVKAQIEARILKEYHTLIEEGKEKFKKELESIVPDVKLGRRGKKLSEDELNSLIAHAHRRIEQLQRQLAEQQAMEQKRFAAALDIQRLEDEAITDAEINRELDKQAGDLAFEHQKKMKDIRREYEEEMRVQLRRQAAAHSDHLQEVLRIQTKEFEEEILKHEAQVREEEVDRYREKMVESLGKLRGIEAAIEGHAHLEKQARRSHELWLACETFKRTIARGKAEGGTLEDKLKPLANEVVAIKEATENNPFVDAVAGAIPETALTRGVFNEESLRQRWQSVRRMCQRVAMVGEEGGSLYQYFISYFQSLLLFTDPAPPTVDEEVDVANLDTCKLLSYANYYVEQNDFEQAVRYVNQLSGMPRHVAADWIKEAKLLLETNQAATALSAHASASGLGGIIL
ncbi:MICOS complex subunit Mic60-like [Amphiura filiformis]|uniref:MICOS complex subunit Mic60-like n=1 Tax=Amphiura filiformis TaxID=82378 RepID=UPI003B21DDA6